MAKELHKKILVVEDEPEVFKALTDVLVHEGFEVLQAQNGIAGLTDALQQHPDLIVLDILMPVLDGISMLQELRKDPWGKDIPVIILTNLNDKKSISDSLESGVYDYLIKSDWTLKDLVIIVKEKLHISQ